MDGVMPGTMNGIVQILYVDVEDFLTQDNSQLENKR